MLVRGSSDAVGWCTAYVHADGSDWTLNGGLTVLVLGNPDAVRWCTAYVHADSSD